SASHWATVIRARSALLFVRLSADRPGHFVGISRDHGAHVMPPKRAAITRAHTSMIGNSDFPISERCNPYCTEKRCTPVSFSTDSETHAASAQKLAFRNDGSGHD